MTWQNLRNRWRDERRLGSPLVPYLWRAYRAGRKARFLVPLVLEDEFETPLDELRQRLGIEPLRVSLNAAALPSIATPAVMSG